MLILFTAGCGGDRLQTFRDGDVSFRYPEDWHVTGFSTTTSPRRLAVTSFPVAAGAIEGDCGGRAAIEALPPSGAVVLLIDYGDARGEGSFAPAPGTFALAAGEPEHYECFGASTRFRFRARGGRAFQAHVAFGATATRETRRRTLTILDSLAGR